MKNLVFLLTVFILCVFSISNQIQIQNNFIDNEENNLLKLYCPSLSPFENQIKNQIKDKKNLDEKSIKHDWYSKAIENIEKDEYSISYSEDLKLYQSPNRANNIRFIFHKDGFSARVRDTKFPDDVKDATRDEGDKRKKLIPHYNTISGWEIRFRVSYPHRFSDKNYKLAKFLNSEIRINKNQASIEDEKMRIDYNNSPEGMRQDFLIKKRPDGNGKLALELCTETKLRVIDSKEGLVFKDNDGKDKMQYSELKVYDAVGRQLEAFFVKSEKNKMQSNKSKNNSTKNFCIVVNDDAAIYPIKIDPLSTSPSWTAENNQSGSGFGYNVATAGDVNGDGYSDVIIGAPFFDFGGNTDEGRVYVYYGSGLGLSTNPAWRADGNQANANFGFSVSTAGDFDGDECSEILVGAPYYDNGQTNEGGAFLWYGSFSGLGTDGTPSNAGWKSEGNIPNANFGGCVSTAGDVNGDGSSDILIGAPYAAVDTLQQAGIACIFLGPPVGPNTSPDWVLHGIQYHGSFGYSVATAGDVNGDQFSDVIIGEATHTNGELAEGGAYVFYGGQNGFSSVYWKAESNQINSFFGSRVSTAGDINGDGFSDVIVGAYLYDNGQTDEGSVFLWYGSVNGLGIDGTPLNADWKAKGDQAYAVFGTSVSTAGDINGDGYSDIVVGAQLYENGQSDEGAVFVWYGSVNGPNPNEIARFADWSSEGNQVNSSFGLSASTAGDINGDGYSDIIVGSFLYDNGQTDEGRTFVYNGSARGPFDNGWTVEISNIIYDDVFNLPVSSAGDINGDGYSDVIFSAAHYTVGNQEVGKVYVYYGSATGLSQTANWTLVGDVTRILGQYVSTAGDVNGDGCSEIVVCAQHYNNGSYSGPAVFIWYGSTSGLGPPSNPDWSWLTHVFSYSASTAGDVNGDGFSDVIIGGSEKAFVYYGSQTGLSTTANWVASENTSLSTGFGGFVATAGDVNGDGYSDVIIGNPSTDYGINNYGDGAAYLWYGSRNGLRPNATPYNADWSARSYQNNSFFGFPVATAGDVNGDGFSDVIVGASSYNTSTSDGKIFVWYGSINGLIPNGSPVNANWTAVGSNSVYFGYSVSTAGDVNSDGYSDLIVGDKLAIGGGRAFIWYGSNTGLDPNGTPANADWSQSGWNHYYGESVSTAGDVNGDGYSDVIVGWPDHTTTSSLALVYYGNDGTGLRATVQQYKPFSNNNVYSGGLTGSSNRVKLNIFGKSPFGRTKGKIIYECQPNKIPFSVPLPGASLTNNTFISTGSGSFTDLGTQGAELNKELSGLLLEKQYKWRARIQYSLSNNPYQKLGPWKYYTNYVPLPYGDFKPQNTGFTHLQKRLKLTAVIEGFYDLNSNKMIPDTSTVFLRNNLPPYSIVDSSKSYLDSTGFGEFQFANGIDSGSFFLQIKHRNSIETWSASAVSFPEDSSLVYELSTAITKAFGSNMIQVDASPVRFAIFSGDANQDGVVDGSDAAIVDNDGYNFVTGYVVSDVTGDSFVDASDAAIVDNNGYNFVTLIRP